MTKQQRAIEGMYQRAMNLRDSSPTPIRPWREAERKYTADYLRAFNRTQDVAAFKDSTRKYRSLFRRSA
jgi:hypothetical protein